jgi:hypothetical protein
MRLTALFALAAAFAVLAWHASASADELIELAGTEPELTAAIDRKLSAVWERDGVTPAPRSSDEEFLRRVYLDTTGMPPTYDEAISFLNDDSPGKRDRLIDALVADRRFAEHVADQWVNVFTGRRTQDNADLILGAWMAQQIQLGRGFDDIMYDIITAEGLMSENPAVGYYTGKREFRTADIAGEAAKHFTGVQIQCAQCHDHPYEDTWTEQEFNGVGSFFAAVQVRRRGDTRPRQGEVTDRGVSRLDPSVVQRRLATIKDDMQRERVYEQLRYRAPKYLLGNELRVDDARLWRKAWAKWVISDQNVQTQRYVANRFWSFLFGMGIVNPVDDFNSINEPSHPELLDLLASDMREHGYDVRRFYRAALKTRAWQASSSGASRGDNRAERWYFAEYPVRQLSPEQFFGALIAVAGHSESAGRRVRTRNNPYERERKQGEAYKKREDEGKLPKNRRRVEYDLEAADKLAALVDSMSPEWYARRSASRQYARISSDDEMNESDGFSMTIDQALMQMNGRVTGDLSTHGRQSLLTHIFNASRDADARLERMFLIVLSRRPTAAESERYKKFLAESGERAGWEDALFSLLLTTEFATNH